MGVDYESINSYDEYQYDPFLPLFFPIKKEQKEESKPLNSKEKKAKRPQSRKNTLDEEREEKKKKTDKKTYTQLNSIFASEIASPFFSSKKEITIINKDEYYLDIIEKDDIRKKYYSQLIYKNFWNPCIKQKKFNSLFIFDWDDTLFPTTFFINKKLLNEENISEEILKPFYILEKIIINIINFAINKGDVYIITNSSIDWFRYSSSKYFPNLKNILKLIKTISSRDEYEELYPGENKLWKEKTFLDLRREINNNLVTNIICLGDSVIELEAGKLLGSKFDESFIKTIKFKENPEIEDLIKQLNLINNKINYIYSKAKNLSITIEQKY